LYALTYVSAHRTAVRRVEISLWRASRAYIAAFFASQIKPVPPHRMARCIVTLANKGDDAYMPHIYGDSIQIERTLNKNGSGGYKIKNHEGKTVDSKKATLDAIRSSHSSPPQYVSR
jgi:hypothetical protein